LVEDGTYTLRFENTNSSIQYVLIDNQLGVEQSITEPYTFVGTNKDSVDRFELQLRESAIPLTTGLHSANKARRLQINSSIKGFILQSDRFAGESADIELMDVTGNSVGTIANKSITSNRTFVPLDLPDGSYIVRVTIGSDVFTGLIVLVK
ncbi:T9SS type A sorting domain-containing protein, partial [uncultured Cytophaga sp.]|uniref:T9SS type A sorting domain-containing protein n=1 Tax=uncultured Cytophaga sp. TaxID=160238 RepID=UPI0026303DC3